MPRSRRQSRLAARPESRPEYQLLESRALLAGTPQLIDINPGAGDSTMVAGTNVGNWSILMAQGPSGGYELWKSDGTAAGTTR
ncbi:MAG: hypothetical protein ACKO0N_17480, partial [Planctomycetota bacterium]